MSEANSILRSQLRLNDAIQLELSSGKPDRMTIVAGVTRVTFEGTLPGGEIFNTSFWVQGDAPTSASDANDMAEYMRDSWESYCGTDWRALLRSDCAWTLVRVYSYPAGGPTAAVVGEAAIASGAGTSFAADMPLQVSMVLTLRTVLAGRRHRGRMYLPWTGGQLTNHQFSQAAIDSVSSSAADLFSNINSGIMTWTVIVLSQVGAGATSAVSTVSVDSLPDIQRRRANRAPELRQSSAPVLP